MDGFNDVLVDWYEREWTINCDDMMTDIRSPYIHPQGQQRFSCDFFR